MKKTYKNRYGDYYTFTKDDDNDILWEGEFSYCRFSFRFNLIRVRVRVRFSFNSI